MKHKRAAISTLIVVCLVLIIPVAGFLVLQSPWLINGFSALLENRTGYRITVRDIAFDRHLRGSVEGLEIRSVHDDRLYLTLQNAEIKGKVTPSFTIEVEKMLLTHPKFVFQVKKSGEETNLFEAIEKLPPLHLLVVQDGVLEIRTGQTRYSIPGIQLKVTDFAPKTGGKLTFGGGLAITSSGYGMTGTFDGAFEMRRFTPGPSGAGSLRLALKEGFVGTTSFEGIESTAGITLRDDLLSLTDARMTIGALRSGQERPGVVVKDVHLRAQGSYNQKTSAFSLASFRAEGMGVGSADGHGKGILEPLSWDVSLTASNIDLPKVHAAVKPLLPEEYRRWTFKGTGDLDLRSAGKTEDSLTWSANVALDLKGGGFTSPDNLKAGEGIDGKVHLRLSSPQKGEKGRFDVTTKAGNGEFLWGKYYRNFKDEFTTFSSGGVYGASPLALSFTGSTDLFRTGRYSFSGDFSSKASQLSLFASNLCHERLFVLFGKDYLTQNYPHMADLTVQGTSEIDLTMKVSDKTSIVGRLTVHDGAFSLPSMSFSIAGLELSLPLHLEYPLGTNVKNEEEAKQGVLSVRKLDAGGVGINGLRIPLLLSRNSLEVTEPVAVPVFGGVSRLEHLRAERILSPEMRFDMALFADNIDLAPLTERAISLPLNGTLSVSLPSIIFQAGGWKTRGRIESNVFGGHIEATGIFGQHLFSSRRSFGADVRFDDIDLNAVTEKLAVGKMTGTVRGFAEDLTFEYGQPARFTFKIETDSKKNGAGRISVDAIENLSIVTGSPAISSILNSGINRFFKEYPYSRLGIACTLENDVFNLRGTIREGGREYLIRRGLFRGIDVINQNPENSISFKDMQERIGRIFRPRQETNTVS